MDLILIFGFFVIFRMVVPLMSVMEEQFGEAKNKVSFTVTGCNEKACNRSCRRLDFFQGICINDRCDCYRFWAQDKILKDLAIIIEDTNRTIRLEQNLNEMEDCDLKTCNGECLRNGSPSGVCVNRYCNCEPIKVSAEDDNSLLNNEQGILGHESFKCNLACHQECRRLGFSSGICLHEKCDCDQFEFKARDSSSTLKDYENINESRNCHLESCNQWCQRFDFSHGTCVKGKCDCVKIKSRRRRICSNREECLTEVPRPASSSEPFGVSAERANDLTEEEFKF